MSEQLKPCPFCGGEAKVFMEHNRETGLTLWCQCKNCYAKTAMQKLLGIALKMIWKVLNSVKN